MRIEWLILIVVWVVTPLLAWRLVPKKRIHEAHIAFLFCQMIGWILELTLVQIKWVDFSLREFPSATRINFTLYILVYPVYTMLSVLHCPTYLRALHKVIYYLLSSFGMMLIALFIETYTDLSEYLNWDWYWTWLIFFIVLYSTHLFTIWFKKGFLRTESP